MEAAIGLLAIQVIVFAVYVLVRCRKNRWRLDEIKWQHPFYGGE